MAAMAERRSLPVAVQEVRSLTATTPIILHAATPHPTIAVRSLLAVTVPLAEAVEAASLAAVILAAAEVAVVTSVVTDDMKLT
jgi:homoserine kinase